MARQPSDNGLQRHSLQTANEASQNHNGGTTGIFCTEERSFRAKKGGVASPGSRAWTAASEVVFFDICLSIS
jgi:hypothetical protein